MLPAVLPTCVFLVLYGVAAAGFFVASLAIEALEANAEEVRLVDVFRAAVNALVWPALALLFVVFFVRSGGRF
jgi:small-conductance mechanosensitive channel